MIRRIGSIAVSLLLIWIMAAFIPGVNGDSEPNDSLGDAESIGEGTVSGEVSESIFSPDDEDYYKIVVPEGNDIEVTAEASQLGDLGSITIETFNSDREEDIFGIYMYLNNEGERDTQSWYNSEGEDTTIYLKVSGNGSYSMDIEFTTDTQDALEALAGACFLGMAGIICIPILIVLVIVAVIVIIIIVLNKKKKK